MTAPPTPGSLCLLRLSAIGDTCHVVPLVRALQRAWPTTRISWIIGRVESKLMRLMQEVEFITIDKSSLWRGGRELRAALGARSFDALLHLQTSLRSSLLSTLVRAPLRIGLDRARARELQWLFTNRRIAAHSHQHMQEIALAFATALGLPPEPPDWHLPPPPEALAWARERIADGSRALVVSPCASHPLRNWRIERYAAVIDHAVRECGMQALLCTSPAEEEQRYAAAIERSCTVPVTNLAGRDTLPQLLALLGRATALLTPDSGPAHMGTVAGVPVIGLYACTRSARTGPWRSRQWCVDRYAVAARRFRGCEAEALRWTADIEESGVMDLIEVDDVIERLEALLAERTALQGSNP
jgi:heptosyltransferase I